MNMHRLTAMTIAVALTGLTHTLAAEENISTTSVNDTIQQNTAEQKPETENLTSEMDIPVQAVSQTSDNLLSELKVYPSF